MLFPELFFYLIGRQPNMSKKAPAFCECSACSVLQSKMNYQAENSEDFDGVECIDLTANWN